MQAEVHQWHVELKEHGIEMLRVDKMKRTAGAQLVA